MRKLNMLVMKKINPDNAESACFQEILLPGHLYTTVMKEKMQEWLQSVKVVIERDAPRAGKKPRYDVTDYSTISFLRSFFPRLTQFLIVCHRSRFYQRCYG
jgi:DNA-directed RNA polymerase I subunit RPA2